MIFNFLFWTVGGLVIMFIAHETTRVFMDWFRPDLPDPKYRFKVVMDYSPFVDRIKVVYRCTERRAWTTARRHTRRVPTGSAAVLTKPHPTSSYRIGWYR